MLSPLPLFCTLIGTVSFMISVNMETIDQVSPNI